MAKLNKLSKHKNRYSRLTKKISEVAVLEIMKLKYIENKRLMFTE